MLEPRRDLLRIGGARLADGLRQCLDHELHAHVHVVVRRLREALAKGAIEGRGLRRLHVGQPVGHRDHLAHAGLAEGGRRAERIAVEGVELAVEADLARSLHEQREVVAPVARDHRLRTAGLDLHGIGREVLHPAHRMQLLAHDLDVGPQLCHLALALAQHGLAEAVVLPDQVGTLHAAVVLEHLHQGRDAHVGMRIEAEVPVAAALVGEDRVDRRVVEEQRLARARAAFVVLGQRIEDGRRRRGGVALHDHGRTVVHGRAQRRQRLFRLALAVVAVDAQWARPAGQRHAAALVHAFGGPQQVAKHRLASVRKGAAEALHQGELDGRARGLAGSVAQGRHA